MAKLAAVILLLLSSLYTLGSHATPDQQNSAALNETVRLFRHAYDGYMQHAFPFDELKPTSCSGTDAYFHGMALTLVDSLDSLAVLGLKQDFAIAVETVKLQFWSHGFNINENVSVFESNIRLLGGLISAHILAVDDHRGIMQPMATEKEQQQLQKKFTQNDNERSSSTQKQETTSNSKNNRSTSMNVTSPVYTYYDGKHLLELALDLGRRLMPAFNTTTGIPYGTVNLRHGVPLGETPITCTACGGSYLLEFAALSRLSGDPSFEHAAHRATIALLRHRDPDTGLLGSHINVLTGEWTEKRASIGSSVDSLYEYLYKYALLFGSDTHMALFYSAYSSTIRNLRSGPWYNEVEMDHSLSPATVFGTLLTFWPGLQAQFGDVSMARESMHMYMRVWKALGATPDRVQVTRLLEPPINPRYALRPEMIESLFWLHTVTEESVWQEHGKTILSTLSGLCNAPCGCSNIANVTTWELEDHMESFFLAETLKYMYLLFVGDDHWVRQGSYVFTTEAHLLPMRLPTSRAFGEDVRARWNSRRLDRKDEVMDRKVNNGAIHNGKNKTNIQIESSEKKNLNNNNSNNSCDTSLNDCEPTTTTTTRQIDNYAAPGISTAGKGESKHRFLSPKVLVRLHPSLLQCPAQSPRQNCIGLPPFIHVTDVSECKGPYLLRMCLWEEAWYHSTKNIELAKRTSNYLAPLVHIRAHKKQQKKKKNQRSASDEGNPWIWIEDQLMAETEWFRYIFKQLYVWMADFGLVFLVGFIGPLIFNIRSLQQHQKQALKGTKKAPTEVSGNEKTLLGPHETKVGAPGSNSGEAITKEEEEEEEDDDDDDDEYGCSDDNDNDSDYKIDNCRTTDTDGGDTSCCSSGSSCGDDASLEREEEDKDEEEQEQEQEQEQQQHIEQQEVEVEMPMFMLDVDGGLTYVPRF